MNIHWKDWCWSWNSNTLATCCEELTHWKRPWCWERLKAGGEGDSRGWDGWMALQTQWTWVWVSSRWWTGRPCVLQSRGSQRVGHKRLNWTELKYPPLCGAPSQTAICLYLRSQLHLLLLHRVPLSVFTDFCYYFFMSLFQLKPIMQVTISLDHGVLWPASIGNSFICSSFIYLFICQDLYLVLPLPGQQVRHHFLNSIAVCSAPSLTPCICTLLFGVSWSDLVKLTSLFFPWAFFSVVTLDFWGMMDKNAFLFLPWVMFLCYIHKAS